MRLVWYITTNLLLFINYSKNHSTKISLTIKSIPDIKKNYNTIINS